MAKRFEKINLLITTGTTNEIVYTQSKIFQGKNSRSNHSLYSQIDKKLGKLNISAGARYEYFSLDSEDGHEINGDTIYHFAEAKPVFRGVLIIKLQKELLFVHHGDKVIDFHQWQNYLLLLMYLTLKYFLTRSSGLKRDGARK